MDLDEPHEYRLAFGDVPSTDAVEPAGRWNVIEHHDLPATGEVFLPVSPLAIEPVLALGGAPASATREARGYRIVFDDGATGDVRLRISYALPGRVDGLVLTLEMPENQTGHVVLYLDPGARIDFVTAQSSGMQPAGDKTMHDFPGVTRTFAVQIGAVAAPPPGPASEGFDWIALAIGAALGAIVWALLVRQGMVQKRSRKQTAGVAAHKQAAAREDKATLEGRKRALMAALKELEVAKMNKDIDGAAYDALKADFKRQAVTTMRALEEAK